MPFRSVCVSFSLSFFGSFLGCMCRCVEVDSVCCVSVRSALAPATHTMGSRSKKEKKKRSGSRFTMTCHPRQPSVTRRMVVSSVIIALAHTRGAHSTARHTQLTYRKSPALLYLTEWLVSPRRYPHNSFEAFFHFQFGLISTPNSDQKLFPSTH